jgi:general secretion pathway protein G
MRKATRKAFTLVEILIVVVILGILAAIVVPQFTNATQDSQAGNIKAQISTLQRQIELYYAKTNAYPTFAGATPWGTPAPSPTGMIGDGYIKEAPKNPAGPLTAAQRSLVLVDGTATGSDAHGWVWNTTDNKLYASYFNENTGLVTPTTP